jgi:hypothetical protein
MSKTNGNSKNSNKKEYTTPEGTVLEFRSVTQWAMLNFEKTWERSKPLPPLIKTEIGEDYNPADERYKHELQMWTTDHVVAISRFVVRAGVVNPVPEQFMTETKAIYPEMTDDDIKVEWVYSLVGSQEEMAKFTEVVVGTTMPTEAGIEEASKSFRSED